MESQIIGVDAQQWSVLRAATTHDVYDAPGYASLSAWQEGGEAAAVYVDGGRDGRLLIPIVIREIDTTLRDAMSPYGYPGILTDRRTDEAFIREAMGAAMMTLRDAGIVSLFIRLHPLIPVAGLDGVGVTVHHRTVAVDLSLPAEQIWAETRTNHRRDIQRALRRGHKFSFDESPQAHAAFRRLYETTMTRLGAADYYFFSQEYFERLMEVAGVDVHLAVVRVGEEIAAAGLFIECCGIVHLHLSASDERFSVERPTKLLYHEVCTWAKARGDHWLHLGGGRGSAEDSLYHFKARFSTYRAEFDTLRIVSRIHDYRALMAARNPDTDANDLTGYFPAYRRPGEPRILGGPQRAAHVLRQTAN